MFTDRLSYISDLNEFINSSKSILNGILNEFGWKLPVVDITKNKDEINQICPIDNGHHLPKNNIENHLLQCKLKKNGYNSDDVLFPPANEKGNHVIVIDGETHEKILANVTGSVGNSCKTRSIPQSSDRFFTDYTPNDRRALYDYAISKTEPVGESKLDDINMQFNKSQNDKKPKTLEELLIAERDAKRRRIRYRSKKVHTGRKTQTEILREVIQSQMEGYEEWLLNQGHKLSDNKNLSLSLEKVENIATSIKEDERVDFPEIVRKWDDWNTYYKGNPHKRYLKVIKEERERKKAKKDNRNSKVNSTNSSLSENEIKYKKDSKYSRHHREYCESKIVKTSSKNKLKHHHREDSKSHDRYYREYERDDKNSSFSESRNNDKHHNYRRDVDKKRYDNSHYVDKEFHGSDVKRKLSKKELDHEKGSYRSSHSISSSKGVDSTSSHYHKKYKHKDHKRKHKKKEKNKDESYMDYSTSDSNSS